MENRAPPANRPGAPPLSIDSDHGIARLPRLPWTNPCAPPSRPAGEMSVLIFHPSTAPFVQQAARALCEARLLDRFYTTVRDDPASTSQRVICAVGRMAGRDLRAQFRRRAVTEIPAQQVSTFPRWELLRLMVGALDREGRVTDLVWEQAEMAFDRRVAQRLHPGLRGVYGFEHSSRATFEAARERGLRVIYDVPAPETNFVQAILHRELEQHPEIRTAYHAHTAAREARRTARRHAEWHAADLVIANSEFTKRSYVAAGLDGGKVCVVPYGAPVPAERDAALRRDAPTGMPVFLWAGTFSIRKGAHHLLAAWREGGFGHRARLRVFGAVTLPTRLLQPLPGGVELCGSVSREELMEEYRAASALVFPTLCDGFGMVATEAWSRGLPVITTECAGAVDLLRPGYNGLLVRAADVSSLAEALVWALAHRAELDAMREGALATAARWQWQDYRQALARAVSGVLAA